MKHLLLTTIAAVLVVGCGDPNGALAKALSPANIEAAKQAIADGADVNEKEEWADGMGWTHLYTATVFGHKEIIELLIAAGADVNADEGTGLTPLHSAANHGRKEIAKLLIAAGADVNAKDVLDVTPLEMRPKAKSPTSSANTAARPRRNWKPLATRPTHSTT